MPCDVVMHTACTHALPAHVECGVPCMCVECGVPCVALAVSLLVVALAGSDARPDALCHIHPLMQEVMDKLTAFQKQILITAPKIRRAPKVCVWWSGLMCDSLLHWGRP